MRMEVKLFGHDSHHLKAEGWIHRHYEPTVPPQVTYSLARRVLELDPVMMELDRIAERWYGKRAKG